MTKSYNNTPYQTEEYGAYDSIKRTFLVERTNSNLKKFLKDTATGFMDDVFAFKRDEIADSLNELLLTVSNARKKYEKKVSSELKIYEKIICKDKKVSS